MQTITLSQTNAVKEILCIDTESSNQELLEMFIDLGIHPQLANDYLRLREHFKSNKLVNRFIES